MSATSTSTLNPSDSTTPRLQGGSDAVGNSNARPKLIIAVTEADSPLGHAIACRLLATNQWAKVLAILRPLPSSDSTPTSHGHIRGNPLATHLHSLGAVLVPSTSRPHLLRAFQAARALVLVPPASNDMANQVAHILDLVKLAGSPAMHLRPVSRDTHGVRAVVFVSDVAAQFPTVEVKIESTAAESNSVAESNKTSKVIKVAKVYKDSEDIVVRLCKRATSIVRAGVIMQDLLPLIETGAQHASIHFNAAKDSQFAPVNASDLALGVHVLAHCLATGRTHPAFAPATAQPATATSTGKGKGKGKIPTSHPSSATLSSRAPHGRIYLFTSPSFESVSSIHAHVTHVLTAYSTSTSTAAALKPGTDLVHVLADLSDAALATYLANKHLGARAPGVRVFHADRTVYHGALIRLGKLATTRSADLERLIMRQPTRFGQVIADHGKRFVPAVVAMDKALAVTSVGHEEGVGHRLDVGIIAAAGVEE